MGLILYADIESKNCDHIVPTLPKLLTLALTVARHRHKAGHENKTKWD